MIMLDLETLGTQSNATIVAIGAVKFTREKVIDEFYIPVAFDNSRFIDADTVKWWMKQSADAQKVFDEKPNYPLASALNSFNAWMGNDPEVWGNGSDFDNVIIADAYKQHNMKWNHRVNRCYRTLKNLMPGIEIKRNGVYHNALNDAHNQAEHMIEILKRLRV